MKVSGTFSLERYTVSYLLQLSEWEYNQVVEQQAVSQNRWGFDLAGNEPFVDIVLMNVAAGADEDYIRRAARRDQVQYILRSTVLHDMGSDLCKVCVMSDEGFS